MTTRQVDPEGRQPGGDRSFVGENRSTPLGHQLPLGLPSWMTATWCIAIIRPGDPKSSNAAAAGQLRAVSQRQSHKNRVPVNGRSCGLAIDPQRAVEIAGTGHSSRSRSAARRARSTGGPTSECRALRGAAQRPSLAALPARCFTHRIWLVPRIDVSANGV